ncbi:MAG TPA: SDR family oxidoreductase [Steroidobacteraceae bacterium]|nr:SDR family oxidoreductase [Steroidobacteraceae bacterium]
MREFEGACVVVTGGAHGIGAAVARDFATLGARVLIIDLDDRAARELAREIGGTAFSIDVRDAVSLECVLEEIDRREQGVDVLVNNVGGGPRRKLEELTVEEWDSTLALNLRSAFIATRGVLNPMQRRGGGSIINVASIAAHGVSPLGGAAYAAAKAGMLALTRQTAYEWASKRIRANAVCPGPTRTLLTEKSRRRDEEFPLGRWLQPEDIAQTIVFLASPRASMCSGVVINVDGAFSLSNSPV